MKSAVRSLLFLIVFVTISLRAQDPMSRVTILAVDGEASWPIAINGQAVGFALRERETLVQIAARLGNGGGRAYLDAYLTKSIGPGASEADQIARTSLDLSFPYDEWTTLFSDLDLEKGVYWLIIAKPRERAHSSLNWFVASPRQLYASCGAVGYLGSMSYTFFGDAAEYIPASKFETKYESTYGFQFEVTAARTAENPCPPTSSVSSSR